MAANPQQKFHNEARGYDSSLQQKFIWSNSVLGLRGNAGDDEWGTRKRKYVRFWRHSPLECNASAYSFS
ncbi:hypothetical protein D3C71_1998770 [compost metagenome]